jgi:fatty-acyl-CoA synthase
MRPREAETLPGLLGELAGGSRAALIHGDRTIAAAELADRAARVAGGLAAAGIGAGDRVALWLPNRPEWLELHLALARLGALTVAVNTRFRAHELRDLLERSQARALAFAPGFKGIAFEAILEEAGAELQTIRVGEAGYDALLAHEPAPDAAGPDAPCVAFTSSGTTGRPKLVLHAQRGIVAHARAVAAGFGYDAPDCVALAMLPLCGVFGYDSALGALAGGAPVVLQQAFDAGEAARLIERHRVTHANGSDAMLLRVLAAAPDPPLREAGFAAFDGDPRAVVDAADAAGTTAYMCYGSTEVRALLAHAPLDGTPERRAIAGGEPVSPDTTVRVAGDGELEIRGPSVTAGYLGDEQPDLTADGFLRTGDLGRALDDGGFAFTARRGDALRLGGFLVSPREIEAFLEQGADIAEAAVVAVEHEGTQRPVAFAVARDGTVLDEAAALERCRASLAAFKVPRRVIALGALPSTDSPNGRKVQRSALRRLAAEALQETPTTT